MNIPDKPNYSRWKIEKESRLGKKSKIEQIYSRIHDNVRRDNVQRINFPHQNVGWDLMKEDVAQEGVENFLQLCVLHEEINIISEASLSLTSILTGLESQYFLLHIKAAWNFVNSSARNSSRAATSTGLKKFLFSEICVHT